MFKTDRITDVLKDRFTISVEIIPPRNGARFDTLRSKILRLASYGVDFISVTKGAGGSLRGGSLPLAHFIQSLGIPSLAHFTCRDYTIEEVENALVDHHYMNINNILALRGDPPAGLHEEYIPREGSYEFAYKLVEHINRMNSGKYLVRKKYDDQKTSEVNGEKTDFCTGVACYPDYHDRDLGVEYLNKKIEAGAEFGITQLVFNGRNYVDYKCKFNIPILPGIHLLSSRKNAEFLKTHMLMNIPDQVIENADNSEWMMDHTLAMIDEMKSGGAPGIHLFIILNTAGTYKLLDKLMKKYR